MAAARNWSVIPSNGMVIADRLPPYDPLKWQIGERPKLHPAVPASEPFQISPEMQIRFEQVVHRYAMHSEMVVDGGEVQRRCSLDELQGPPELQEPFAELREQLAPHETGYVSKVADLASWPDFLDWAAGARRRGGESFTAYLDKVNARLHALALRPLALDADLARQDAETTWREYVAYILRLCFRHTADQRRQAGELERLKERWARMGFDPRVSLPANPDYIAEDCPSLGPAAHRQVRRFLAVACYRRDLLNTPRYLNARHTSQERWERDARRDYLAARREHARLRLAAAPKAIAAAATATDEADYSSSSSPSPASSPSSSSSASSSASTISTSTASTASSTPTASTPTTPPSATATASAAATAKAAAIQAATQRASVHAAREREETQRLHWEWARGGDRLGGRMRVGALRRRAERDRRHFAACAAHMERREAEEEATACLAEALLEQADRRRYIAAARHLARWALAHWRTGVPSGGLVVPEGGEAWEEMFGRREDLG